MRPGDQDGETFIVAPADRAVGGRQRTWDEPRRLRPQICLNPPLPALLTWDSSTAEKVPWLFLRTQHPSAQTGLRKNGFDGEEIGRSGLSSRNLPKASWNLLNRPSTGSCLPSLRAEEQDAVFSVNLSVRRHLLDDVGRHAYPIPGRQKPSVL